MTKSNTVQAHEYKSISLINLMQETDDITNIGDNLIHFKSFNIYDRQLEHFSEFIRITVQKLIHVKFKEKHDLILNHYIRTSGDFVGKPTIAIELLYKQSHSIDESIFEFIDNAILCIVQNCVDKDLFNTVQLKIPKIDTDINIKITDDCKEYLSSIDKKTIRTQFTIKTNSFEQGNIGKLQNGVIEYHDKPQKPAVGFCVFMGYSKCNNMIELKILESNEFKTGKTIKVRTDEHVHFYRRPLEEEKGLSHEFEIAIIGDIKDNNFKLKNLKAINIKEAINDSFHGF